MERVGKYEVEMAVTEARPSVVQIRKGTAGTPLYFIEAGSAELHADVHRAFDLCD